MPAEADPEALSRIERARIASGDEFAALLHDGNAEVIQAALRNPQLDESHLCTILDRLELPAAILEAIGSHPLWLRSEAVKVRMARHPRTPPRISLPLVRQIYLFDLVGLSLAPSTPAEVRRLSEETIIGKIPQLPLGQKITLARRGPGRVAGALLVEGHAQVNKVALNNPRLNESQILKVLAKPGLHARVVAAIAQHPKWSCEYNVRLALLRNPQTPYPTALSFLGHVTPKDLHDLATLQILPARLRKHILDELRRRTCASEASSAV
jgi:hypothetical protein